MAVCLSLATRHLGPAIEAQKRELTRASKYANTAMTSINTVKAFNGQEQEIWQYYETIKLAAAKYLVQARVNALQFGIIKFAMIGIFLQGFWYGLVLVRQGLDPGHVLTAFYACLFSVQAVEIILPQWLVLTKGMSAAHTLKSIMIQMQDGRKITNMTGCIKPTACIGDIEVNEVSYKVHLPVYCSSDAGIIRISIESSTRYIIAGQLFLPFRGDDLCCWHKRIWKDNAGESAYEVLRDS